MPQIEIDFEVWKALTARRTSESHSYNSVLREMLSLDGSAESGATKTPKASENGKLLGGRFLPDGTQLRARYKGQTIVAQIENGELIDQHRNVHNSASSAARAITGGTFNGLVFWEVKRPSDLEWRKIVALPKQS